MLESYLTGEQNQEIKAQKSQEEFRKQIMQEIEEKQRQQKLADDMRSFANATNENGESLHPLLNNEGFIDEMDKLYTIYPDKSLHELYDMVVWSNPQYREQAVAEQAQKLVQAKDVEKAKSAIGVKPSIPSNNSTQQKDWRGVLDDEVGSF